MSGPGVHDGPADGTPPGPPAPRLRDHEACAALDIGGAHIKAACGPSWAHSRAFELWREPGRLAAEIGAVLRDMPAVRHLAITTTAELCDCYATKREGVVSVIEATVEAVRSLESPGPVELRVWRNDGRLVDLADALREPVSVAAANWLALARLAAFWCGEGPGILADLGSTTTDLVPIRAGRPCPRGLTDTERLLSQELVYTGLRRTPVHAELSRLPYRGLRCPAIPELFATLDDVHITLGQVEEDLEDRRTADGRPRTRDGARRRLARTVGADIETFTPHDALSLARAVAEAQRRRIDSGLLAVEARLGEPPRTAILAGEGEKILRVIVGKRWPRCRLVGMGDTLGAEISRAACAHALAWLLSARLATSSTP